MPRRPFLLRPGVTVVAVGIPPDPALMVGAPPDVMAIPILNIVDTVMAAMREIAEA